MTTSINKDQDAKFIADVQAYADRRAEEMQVPRIKISRSTGYACASDPPRESSARDDLVY